jgi:hypothetical protein
MNKLILALEQKHKELGEKIERLKQTEGVWLPKLGDAYWLVCDTGKTYQSTNYHTSVDLGRISHHTGYQYEALANKASILQKRANLIIQACLNFDPDFEPDWTDKSQRKYGFYRSHYHVEWHTTSTWLLDDSVAYVSTSAIANKVVTYLNSQEIK